MPPKNEFGYRKDSNESITAKQAKEVFDPVRKPDQEIDKLNQNLNDIRGNLEELTKELDKITQRIINETPGMKIQNNIADELKNSKLKINKEIKSQSEEQKRLKQDQREIIYRKEELKQKLIETEDKKLNLQSLQNKLNNAGQVIHIFLSPDSQPRDYQSIKRVIEVLKQTNAELGNRQEVNNELASIEDRLKHLEEVNTLIEKCKAPLEGALLRYVYLLISNVFIDEWAHVPKHSKTSDMISHHML